MKKGLHPETYRLVAFKDMSNETVFITRSCAETKETLMVDGVGGDQRDSDGGRRRVPGCEG